MKQIAFFGSIGVGKTTLGKKLKENYNNVDFLEENLNENPFLSAFYKDMKKWGFHSSIAMLTLMSSYYKKIDSSKDIIILDNGVEELIAYTMLEYDMGILTDEEYIIYRKLYDNIVSILPKIDLYVYFKCDVLEALKRISLRNRDFESDINQSFLNYLNAKYEIFVESLPKDKIIILDTTNGYDINTIVKLLENKLGITFVKKY